VYVGIHLKGFRYANAIASIILSDYTEGWMG